VQPGVENEVFRITSTLSISLSSTKLRTVLRSLMRHEIKKKNILC
jgi:hypothetical protein